jgi:hypothetical protein
MASIPVRYALRFLKIWIACLIGLEAFCFLVAFPVVGGYQAIILSRSWRVTTGAVVAVDRGNHDSATVQYLVGGQEFSRAFSLPFATVGESMDVYYSPERPALSSLERPDLFLRGEVRFFGMAGLIQATFVALSIAAYRPVRTPLTLLARLTLRPRFFMTGIAIAVFVGVISGLFSASSGARLWFGDVCVLCGVGLLCARAFRVSSDVSWLAFVRSKAFAIGVILILAGQLAAWNSRM